MAFFFMKSRPYACCIFRIIKLLLISIFCFSECNNDIMFGLFIDVSCNSINIHWTTCGSLDFSAVDSKHTHFIYPGGIRREKDKNQSCIHGSNISQRIQTRAILYIYLHTSEKWDLRRSIMQIRVMHKQKK